ncbi:AAA family ATPase [Arthrobacter sp. Z1-15]
MSTKITAATLTNFQRVSFAKIEPTGNLIVLAGKNRAGKTSTNDGIEAALCGHNSRNIKRPIKDGHGKGSVEIQLSDGAKLIRTYTPSGTTLKGTDAEGNKFGQAEIDRRISSLGIDGRRFISLGEKEQLKALLNVVDLPFIPAELDAERKRIFDKRADANRAVKDLTARAGQYGPKPAGLPDEEVSVSELLAEHRAGQTLNHQIHVARTARDGWADKVERMKRELAEAEEQLKSAQQRLDGATKPVDLEAIQSQIDTAEQVNAAVRTAKAADEVRAALATAKESADALTTELEAIDKTKTDGLAAAEMPVEGLTFDDEGVLYQGVPFSRASGREQLIVSCAMIMATDPELRVIVIRDGNVLDMEGMQLLQDMAEATDFQIFIEIVAEDAGDHEFYFADGELAV